jgi:hypothetical protein
MMFARQEAGMRVLLRVRVETHFLQDAEEVALHNR